MDVNCIYFFSNLHSIAIKNAGHSNGPPSEIKCWVSLFLCVRVRLCGCHRSERAKRTGATGAILKEASQINRSLMQLGLVVSRLAFLSEGNQNAPSASSPSAGGGGHIPYRNSKLTHLLADSLGGRALAVMVTCVSPSSFDQEETVNGLN